MTQEPQVSSDLLAEQPLSYTRSFSGGHHLSLLGGYTYQDYKNDWTQNGHDAFMVEGGKYGLGRRDLAANVNWFSKVAPAADGTLAFDPSNSPAGSSVDLRFEMDTLVLLHTCPHPMNLAADYPRNPVGVQFRKADPVAADDYCLNFRSENGRGFQNNDIYHLCGADAGGHSC